MLLWIVVLICFTTIAHAQNWTVTGSLRHPREWHTATLLPNGNVLVAGGTNEKGDFLNSAEAYNPTIGLWTVTGHLTYTRHGHTATLLPNGNVLVAGGDRIGNTAEVYNAITGVWTVTGSLTTARFGHTATLLSNGHVLVAGGYNNGFLSSAEVYNPTTGVWTVTGSLTDYRYHHTATLLPNGNVLVAGGEQYGGLINSAELYIATTGVWTVTGNLTYIRHGHTATLLPNGNVLVAAGRVDFNALNSAELYNAATGVWTMTGNLTYARKWHTATLLSNGNVLVAAGSGNYNGYFSLNSAEVYNATTGVWTVTGSMITSGYHRTATLLQNGLVLASGLNSELFSFETNFQLSTPAATTKPTIPTTTNVAPIRVFSDKTTFELESTPEQKFRSEQCHAMYAKSNIPGAYREATIQVMVLNATVNNPGDFLVAIYSQDEFKLGTPEDRRKNIICSQELYEQRKCGISQVGEIILTPLHDGTRDRVILDSLVKGDITEPYIVKLTGLHCIAMYSTNGLYAGDIYFQYPYGNLPPIRYRDLSHYGLVSFNCGIIGLFWMVLCANHWEQITKVQIYCGGIILLCLLEATLTFAYYTRWNSTGVDDFALFAASYVLAGVRSTVSLVALFILCKGYGLVNDAALGYTTWFIVLGLGLCNFVLSVPTTIIFYVWMLYSISKTIAHLSGEKQIEKRTTFFVLSLVLFVLLALSLGWMAIVVINANDLQYYKTTWELEWLIHDISFYLVDLFLLIGMLNLFRSQHDNVRVGVDQLATEEPNDDFDMLDKKNMKIFVDAIDAI